MEQNTTRGDAELTESPAVRGVVVTGMLAAGALYYIYRRSRPMSAQGFIAAPANRSGALVQRGQRALENTLDQVSEEAMAEVKVIVKRGLHRLETMIDDL